MEMILFFAIGYFFGALRSFGAADLRNPDRILRWDPDVFGWRPVPPGTKVDESETVLFAFEMKKDVSNEEG